LTNLEDALHRGLYSDRRHCSGSSFWGSRSQPPLHRGLYSDPRSSKHHPYSSPACLNPLFIGACIRTEMDMGCCRSRCACLNPLFIGACIRTWVALTTTPTPTPGLNPLFIGACIRTGTLKRRKKMKLLVSTPSSSGPVFGPSASTASGRESALSQPPLHRGLYSDRLLGRTLRGTLASLNPLFIGACIRTIAIGVLAVLLAVASQPLLHRGLYSDLQIEGAMCNEWGWSQPPLHRGLYSDEEGAIELPDGLRFGSQPPLHRGLYSDWGWLRPVPTPESESQPPLHRGLYSDLEAAGCGLPQGCVSTPSSSGPVFGRAPAGTDYIGELMSQPPLHRGLYSDP